MINCKSCNSEIVFTQNDDEFFRIRGFEKPKYCKICRYKKNVEAYTYKCVECNKYIILSGIELDKLTTCTCGGGLNEIME